MMNATQEIDMTYYEIIIYGTNNSRIQLFYPTVKGSSNAKRHATIMADRLGRWKYINIFYVNESADVRDMIAQRIKTDNSWINLT